MVVVCFVCLSRVHCQPSLVSSVVPGVRTKDCIRSGQDKERRLTKLYFVFSISFTLLTVCIVSPVWKGQSFCGSAERELQKKQRSCLSHGFRASPWALQCRRIINIA